MFFSNGKVNYINKFIKNIFMTVELIDSKTLIRRFHAFFDDYMKKEIKKALASGNTFLDVSFFDISEYDFELGDYILAHPEDSLAIMEETLKQFQDEEVKTNIKIRFLNLPATERVLIRDIRSEQLGKLILLEGLVRRKTDVRPRLTHFEYLCTNPSCTYAEEKIKVPQIEEKAKTLKVCPKCKSGVELIHKNLIDSQILILEEIAEQLDSSADQPKRINVLLQGDLVSPFKDSKTNPGSRVQVIGLVKEIPVPTRTGAESINYDLIIDGNSISLSEEEFSEIVITKEEEEQIKELAKEKEVLKKLVANTAPSIYGYERIKEAILLQQFKGAGGTKGDGVKTRGDIHILLIGDPGAAKSQMLKAATRIAPKSSFVSGKSATGAGLVASVIKDELTKGWALEAGAMVLASGGLLAIDEMDKMSDEDTSSMHEALEQQCYHHDFELQFADGSSQKIGEYVDNLFDNNKNSIIEGVDCEILNINSESLITTDFNKLSTIVPQRISRHKPFDCYYKITYQNGRSITVTPEHPVFIYQNNEIKEISAALVKKDMLAPTPKKLNILGKKQRLNQVSSKHHNIKEINLPLFLTPKLSKLLGLHSSEGHSYKNEKNRTYEIGISNTDVNLVKEIEELFKLELHCDINTNLQKKESRLKATKDLYTIRSNSKLIYEFFSKNFPESMEKAPKKRVPQLIKKSRKIDKKAYLQGYFLGDGFIASNRFGYATSSYLMACDLHDLLLNLGIQAYIATEKRNFKNYYKVVISGGFENLELFSSEILNPNDKRYDKIQDLINISKKKKTSSELIPYEFVVLFNDFLKKLKLCDGSLTTNILRKQNSNKEVILSYFEKAKSKLKFVKDLSILKQAKEIQDFLNSDIRYLRIKSVEKIKDNSKKWVYDVTVLPNNTFISQGLVLHNTVSIAKANIRATLRCETTVLGAANPKLGRFDPFGDIGKQINFPPALISRFDLIFILRDEPDKKRDDLIADHILQTHRDKSKSITELSKEFLQKYIAYARALQPVLTQDAIKKIKDFYVSIRNAAGEDENGIKSVPITARQLEAIVRLGEAYAKVELKKTVTEEHASKAIDLLLYCLQKIGIDPKTGEMDIDRLTTGVTSSTRNVFRQVQLIIDKLERENPEVTYDSIIEEADKVNVTKADVDKTLEKLKQEGVIFEPRKNLYKKLN